MPRSGGTQAFYSKRNPVYLQNFFYIFLFCLQKKKERKIFKSRIKMSDSPVDSGNEIEEEEKLSDGGICSFIWPSLF